MYIKETYCNDTEKCIYGETGIYKTWANKKEIGDLFKELKSKYGKAKNMYVESKNEEDKKVGWTFENTVEYEDSDEKYKRSVWIEVFVENPETDKDGYEFARYPFTA